MNATKDENTEPDEAREREGALSIELEATIRNVVWWTFMRPDPRFLEEEIECPSQPFGTRPRSCRRSDRHIRCKSSNRPK